MFASSGSDVYGMLKIITNDQLMCLPMALIKSTLFTMELLEAGNMDEI